MNMEKFGYKSENESNIIYQDNLGESVFKDYAEKLINSNTIDVDKINPKIISNDYFQDYKVEQSKELEILDFSISSTIFDPVIKPLDIVDETPRIKQAADFRKARLASVPAYKTVSDKLVSAWKSARSRGKNGLPFMTPGEKQITFFDTQYTSERHRRLTPRLQEIFARPALRRELLDSIDNQCVADTVEISEAGVRGEKLDYDVVIVGSGPHGTLAATEIREQNPDAKILIIDKNERIGGQFRQYGDQAAFFMNSRVRRASRSLSPVPRTRGNINPMGDFAPMQLSDVVRRIYADNTQIGDITAVNAYLSADNMLIETEVKSVGGNILNDTKEVSVENVIGSFTVNARYVIEATGVSQKSSINGKVESQISHSNDPSYWQTADIYSLFGRTKEDGENALEPFDGKKVALIGGGDSALTTLEAMLGVLPEDSYGMYGPGRLSPSDIVWLGAPATTAKEIDDCLRSRYKNGIIQALPKSPNDDGSIVKPVDQKVIGFRKNEGGGWVVFCENGSRYTVDVLIDCTNDKNGQASQLVKDGSSLPRLPGYGGIYQVGPGSGFELDRSTQRLVKELGIGENTVALWARAPKTAEIARKIAVLLKPAVTLDSRQLLRTFKNTPQTFPVKRRFLGIGESDLSTKELSSFNALGRLALRVVQDENSSKKF